MSFKNPNKLKKSKKIIKKVSVKPTITTVTENTRKTGIKEDCL